MRGSLYRLPIKTGIACTGDARFFMMRLRTPRPRSAIAVVLKRLYAVAMPVVVSLCLLLAGVPIVVAATPVQTGTRDTRAAVMVAPPARAMPPVRGVATQAGLDDILTLANGGATALALRLLDQQQSTFKTAPRAWMRREEVRVRIYVEADDWTAMAARLARLPTGLPTDFVLWARTQRVEALLALHRGVQARRVLRRLIWSVPAPERIWLKQWRRLVIRSYLVEGAAADAYTALLRFHQDYEDRENVEDLALQARILLTIGRPVEAALVLGKRVDNPELRSWSLLARLQAHQLSPRRVIRRALAALRDKKLGEALQARFWAVIAAAALRADNTGMRANALEHVLAVGPRAAPPTGVFKLDANALWAAYEAYARHFGNRSHLLIGDDAPWFAAAMKRERKYPVKARAIYALLIRTAPSAADRDKAATALIAQLHKRDHGANLLLQLFLDKQVFPQLTGVPLAVRHEMVDIALARSNIDLASAVMATLSRPPNDADAFMWQLRRARILIYGGHGAEGASVLQSVLKADATLDKARVAHLLQVVFDLQTLGENDTALALFRLAFARSPDRQQRREILYWMGGARMAQKRYADAARLYLRSAMLGDPAAMDPWGQTARYQAAGALAKAGLASDARTVYRRLLAVTHDAARRAVLNHDLQKLWLKHAARVK